ncbi:MAG: J domain-containing protein [Steroidobacteraceae bacterium]
MNPDDGSLKELFEKHSEASFDAVKQEEMQRLKEEAEELTGLDLGDEAGIRTEEDLIQRMYEQMAAREAAQEASQSAESRHRHEAAVNRRTGAAAQLVRQSLREIYRKLASAVHPDRESDPLRRKEKNALMQKINQAYAANDLLTLFEVQIEIGKSDPDPIGTVSSQRLKEYNKLLAQQLQDAKATMRELEAGFRMDFGLTADSHLSPQKLNLVTQRQARAIRAEITRQKEFLSLLSNKTATQRWLKEQRTFASAIDS